MILADIRYLQPPAGARSSPADGNPTVAARV